MVTVACKKCGPKQVFFLSFPIIIAIFSITFGHTWLLRGKPPLKSLIGLYSLQVYVTILAVEEEKEGLWWGEQDQKAAG